MTTEQAELDQLAETELARLQRQLRKLQTALDSLLDEKKNQLIKQERLIGLLQKEHEKIKTDLFFLQNGGHMKKQSQNEIEFEKIAEIYAEHRNKLKQEKLTFLELEGHIKKIEKEINILRKSEVPDSCYKETIKKVKKNVVKLENRLDVVNKKSSDVLTDIFKLRSSIDHILQDRTHFNEMWQSMVTQFNEGKKYIMDLVDQSTLAFDQREELCTKLQALKDRSETDKMLHIQEMREVQRKLEHDAKLQQFYDVKGHKRINSELDARENNKKIQMKEEFEKQLTEYHTLLQKIKALSEEDAIEKIYSQFSTQQEENFALFNYVNELGHEVELLNETVQVLNENIDKQKEEFEEIAFKKKTETFDYLHGVQNELQRKLNESAKNKQNIYEELQLVLEGVENLFQLIRCEDVPILSVLSCKNFISVHNVNLFLGIVAKKINTLVTNINTDEVSNKILSKKDRVPKFNIKESAKQNQK